MLRPLSNTSSRASSYVPEFQQLMRRGARELSVVEGQTLTLDLTLTPDI